MRAATMVTSMPMTASVRIRVPRGSPNLIARHSACRTTPNAEVRMAAKSQTKRNITQAALDKFASHALSKRRNKATLTTPMRIGHSVREIIRGGDEDDMDEIPG